MSYKKSATGTKNELEAKSNSNV